MHWVDLGADPLHPVAWIGMRMDLDWLYCGPRGEGHLAEADHDYPCGPAKKLWGHKNNDPVHIALAPDLSAVLARFEHDATIASSVPTWWQRAGDVHVATFPPDVHRAVVFAQPDNIQTMTDDLTDEDARHVAPGVALGPNATARYAVDPAIEAIARDANRAGRHDEAAAIRLAHSAIELDETHIIAIPGTRNVLVLARDPANRERCFLRVV